MIRVASYCRVSTDQEDQANSYEAQQRYFRTYIQNHPDWELYEIYADEGISGTSTKKRTQFNRMISDAYEGKFHMIITKEVSRFSRNILDTIAYTRQLRSIGIGVVFANDRINTLEPEAEMLLSFLASLAQEESRRTSSRVVWGQTRQMEQGVVFGSSMLGYNVADGVLSIEPEGAEIVRSIFRMYAQEQISTAQIARKLTAKGYQTHRGNTKWTSNAVIKILNNEKYVGDLVQKKTYTPDFLTHEKRANKGDVPFVTISNHHEPIISREVWNLTQSQLAQNDKHRISTGHSNRYVFSGKIKCGECASSFVSRSKQLKAGDKIRRWSCAAAARGGSAGCNIGKLIRDDDALQMLKTAIRSLPVDHAAISRRVAELAVDAILAWEHHSRDNIPHLQFEITRIQKKKEAVMDSYFSQEIPREDMQAMNQKYSAQIEALHQQLKDTALHQKETPEPQTLRSAIQAEITNLLNGETTSEAFYKNMLDCLTVFRDRHMELRLKHLPQVFHFSDHPRSSTQTSRISD